MPSTVSKMPGKLSAQRIFLRIEALGSDQSMARSACFMEACIADSSPLRLAHGVQSLLVSTTRAVLVGMRAPNRDESSHSSARTWAMSFHISPRCNNGMHIHIHSERFALY